MNKTFLLALLVNLVVGESYSGEKVLECALVKGSKGKLFSTLDIWGYDLQAKTFTVRVLDDKEYKLVTNNTKCKVKIDDLTAHVNKLADAENNNLSVKASTADPFFNNYQSYATIGSTLQQWATQYPDYATFIPSIGKSTEGRDIYAFKITNKKSTGAKKGIWFNSGLHAREWIGPASCLYSLKKLLENASSTEVADLLNTFEFHFTPLANPDGYEYSRSTSRLWRKNRRNNGGSYGVDLNRNWNDHWGVVGSSTNPRSDTYQGPSPNSEPEVKALAAYALNIPNRYGGIDFHSYSQLVLRNWGWTTQLSANEKLVKPLGDAMRDAFATKGYNYVSETSADLYPASGALDDWMASVGKLVSFTVELCPGEGSSIGFQLPASEIVKCSEGSYAAILAYSKYLKQNPNIPPNTPIP
ncbi:putative carboxypeptidase precursor [Neoconidiobolus thromboides FSU 785]|nr:putative carboxypeptidase precursor [Neoconidiobolus thromboides FSU 785]